MNKDGRIVRDPIDPRVARTQHALTQALIDLVLEKGWNAITIQNLLDRAGVGRSTFYSHYRGKEDLLLRSFERLLDLLDAAIGDGDARLAPVRELFEHVGGFRPFHRALIRGKVIDRVFQTGTEHLSRTIERRLTARPDAVPVAIEARAHAGAVFALLRWWVEQDEPYPPERMDSLFHAMASRPH